ncbi:hypothetical protein IEQ34_001026 [Dendrobium chrysotoxum]|uniref:Uncharacterized protein n=1 Tax=Dendrobium chrysotoxum TaxID=161865 RepID=A0AAV7HN25_DENCH|nr:hypothetical protein IEQ34_001026 [Dendrobium chrysotoxum]
MCFVGLLFAALTGLVFKEGLCYVFAAIKFQQPIKDDIGDKSVFTFNALPEADKDALIKKLQKKMMAYLIQPIEDMQ